MRFPRDKRVKFSQQSLYRLWLVLATMSVSQFVHILVPVQTL
jgi:hypothetical protein